MGAAGHLGAQDVPHRLELPPLGWRLGKLNYGPPVSMTIAQFQRGKGPTMISNRETTATMSRDRVKVRSKVFPMPTGFPEEMGEGSQMAAGQHPAQTWGSQGGMT